MGGEEKERGRVRERVRERERERWVDGRKKCYSTAQSSCCPVCLLNMKIGFFIRVLRETEIEFRLFPRKRRLIAYRT